MIRAAFMAWLVGSGWAWAAGPNLESVEPRGLIPGRTNHLILRGTLPGAVAIYDVGARGRISISTGQVDRCEAEVWIDKNDQRPVRELRCITTNGISAPVFVMLDDLRATVSTQTNRTIQTAQSSGFPVAIDGTVEPLQFQYFSFAARKGERVAVEIVAQRLGSKLDPVLRLLNEQGRELAYNDDDPAVGVDSRLEFIIPANGRYFIELRDINYEGGPGYFFRCRLGNFPLIAAAFPSVDSKASYELISRGGRSRFKTASRPPFFVAGEGKEGRSFFSCPAEPNDTRTTEVEPNNEIAHATPARLPGHIWGRFEERNDRDIYGLQVPEGKWLFKAVTRGMGTACDLTMRLLDEGGAAVADSKVSADDGSLTNTFKSTGKYFLEVRELNGLAGPDLVYRIDAIPLAPGFEISLDSDKVSVAPGEETKLRVSVQRREYTGGVELEVKGLPEQFKVGNARIAEKTNETILSIQAPSGAERGAVFAVAILGHGEKEGGSFTAKATARAALERQFPQMGRFLQPFCETIVISVGESSPLPETKPEKKKKN